MAGPETSSAAAEQRRARLERSRLYFVTDAGTNRHGLAAEAVARLALEGGADIVQLRDKEASDERLLDQGSTLRDLCREFDALFFVNDRADLALALDADGLHVGQDDLPVDEAREILGPEMLIGLSTHSPDQFDAATTADIDQISAGPVWETPTKAGRPAAGLGLIEHAAASATRTPWFAIGGIDAGNARLVVSAGARRICVVRAIADAPHPREAAAGLRSMIGAAK